MFKNIIYFARCTTCENAYAQYIKNKLPTKCLTCSNILEHFEWNPLVANNSILAEADRITDGEKREAYGNVNKSFNNIAGVWSMIIDKPISDAQVALMMIAFKLVRESHKHSRDNLVDICGYTKLLGQLHNET